MPRGLTTAMQTEVAAQQAEFTHLVELNFSSGILRLATGSQDVVWGGYTWSAIGGRLEFNEVAETTDDKGQGVEMGLSGVDQTILALILGQQYIGRRARMWRVHWLNGAIVADPFMIFSGLMNDGFEVEETVEEEQPTVTIRGRMVSRLAVFDQARGILTNMQSHQSYYPGDTFFQNVPALPMRIEYWGVPHPPGAPT